MLFYPLPVTSQCQTRVAIFRAVHILLIELRITPTSIIWQVFVALLQLLQEILHL